MMDEPPFLVPPPPPRVGPVLATATALVGLLQLGLAIAAAQKVYARPDNISGEIGFVIGSVAVWPLVVIGLFSIGRPFRTNRNRTIILLCVWGLGSLANLANLGAGSATPPPVAVAWDDPKAMRPAATEPSVPSSAAPTPVVATPAGTEPEPPLAPLKSSTVRRKRYNFSAGSHERLIKEIEHAQEDAYHEVVAAYARECADWPADATLALERVEFIGHFSGAEDVTIESAEADYEAARADLVKGFPHAPGTILFVLEHSYGPEFATQAESYSAQTKSWGRTDVARFALLRARRLPDKDPAAKLNFAETSFRNEPTADAGILYARALHAKARDREAAQVLEHAVFAGAPAWTRKQQLDLLFDVGERRTAVGLFKELEQGESPLVNTTETAGRLAEAGELKLARAVLARVPHNQWSRERVAEQRFQFELKYGGAQQAATAYREMRSNGYQTDPFLRHRADLFLRHPTAGWSWMDLAGAVSLGLILGLAGLAPLAVLLPVHYWSLVRARRNRVATWSISPWGLRSAWLLTGATLAALTISLWAFQPKILTKGFGGEEAGSVAAPTGEAVLSSQVVLWVITGGLVTVMLWRAKAWRLLGSGEWGLWKSLGVGVGLAWGLRLVLAVYLKGLGLDVPPPAVISPLTTGLLVTMLKTLGPVGLLAVTGLFVPVLEEIMFRGILLGALARHIPFWAANLLQAAGFTLMHEEPKLAPFFVGFALVNGFLVREAKGLLPAITLHACNNILVSVGLIILQGKAG